MEYVVFYREWLPLPKAEFNILAMAAEQGGSFSGNLSDICRYLGVTPQTSNRNTQRTAMEGLSEKGFITHKSSGRTIFLEIIPKETEINLPRRWVQSVINHDYSSESVAFAQVLKLFMWIADNKREIVTNDEIATELGISESAVCYAKNVLEREYENITKRRRSEKIAENFFINLGQELQASAWWTEL